MARAKFRSNDGSAQSAAKSMVRASQLLVDVRGIHSDSRFSDRRRKGAELVI
jgi:hypothetical protein